METKQQRNNRLREMRKKYHLGEFKNYKRAAKKHNLTKYKRGENMARHRKARRTNSAGMGNIMGTAVGVGGYILFEALLEPKIASVIGNGMVLNIAELAAGVYLSRKGGVIGNVGKAAVVINAYQILQPLLAGVTSQYN